MQLTDYMTVILVRVLMAMIILLRLDMMHTYSYYVRTNEHFFLFTNNATQKGRLGRYLKNNIRIVQERNVIFQHFLPLYILHDSLIFIQSEY